MNASLRDAAHYDANVPRASSGIPYVFSKGRQVSVQFGEFELDAETRQLRRQGTLLHLSPKAFALLAILLEQRPRVVAKDVLRERLWGGTNVLDANLNNLVSEVRAALDDDPQQPRFLRTAHRVGYAFCGTVGDAPPAAEGARATCWLVWHERTLMIDGRQAVIGRDPKCELWIDAPGVSRRHASIRIDDGGAARSATIEDLGSTNGTFVDGRRLTRPATVTDGQTIAIGDATLTFRTWSSVEAPTKRIRRGAKSG